MEHMLLIKFMFLFVFTLLGVSCDKKISRSCVLSVNSLKGVENKICNKKISML